MTPTLTLIGEWRHWADLHRMVQEMQEGGQALLVMCLEGDVQIILHHQVIQEVKEELAKGKSNEIFNMILYFSFLGFAFMASKGGMKMVRSKVIY